MRADSDVVGIAYPGELGAMDWDSPRKEVRVCPWSFRRSGAFSIELSRITKALMPACRRHLIPESETTEAD